MKRAVSSWGVYILRCGDGTLYTGSTNDRDRRLRQHAAGRGARYTRSRLPVTLVYEERVADRGAALRREAALKRMPRSEKLRLLGAAAPDGGERMGGLKIDSSAPRKWTVPPVYRAIVKKNERQAKGLYDVLICGHAVPAATDNTFRKARPCPDCRVRVQEYADQHTAPPAPTEAAASKARPAAKAPRRKAEAAKSAARAKPAPPGRDVARAPRPARRRAAARA